MSLFRKTRVCTECRVVFAPDGEPNFPDLCQTHRAPKLELLRRRKFVLAWADRHWEELESKALEEDARQSHLSQEALRQYAASAQNAASPWGNALGAIFDPKKYD